jgi:hypothetical protein
MAALFTKETLRDNTIMVMMPSDQTIQDEAAWLKAMRSSIEQASLGGIVTLGVTPQSPLVATENPRLAAARSRAPIDSTLIPCSPFDTRGFGDTLRRSHLRASRVTRTRRPVVSP